MYTTHSPHPLTDGRGLQRRGCDLYSSNFSSLFPLPVRLLGDSQDKWTQCIWLLGMLNSRTLYSLMSQTDAKLCPRTACADSSFYCTQKSSCVVGWAHTVYYTSSISKWKIPPTHTLVESVSCETRYLFSPPDDIFPFSWPPLNEAVTPKAAGSQTKAFPSGVEHF